jgi:hypothetical protein
MEQFVVTVTVGEEYVYSADVFIAVECDSLEELYTQLTDAIKVYAKRKKDVLDSAVYENLDSCRFVSVCGSNFDLEHFVWVQNEVVRSSKRRPLEVSEVHALEPQIMSLSQWFEAQKRIVWHSSYSQH